MKRAYPIGYLIGNVEKSNITCWWGNFEAVTLLIMWRP